MKLHLPKGLLAAVLATFFSTQAINAEIITITTDSSISDYTGGHTGIIVEGAELDFGNSSGSTLADGITINNGGIVTYGGTSQSCFAPNTVIKVNAGGKLILTGTNDGLGWNPYTVTSLTLEGTEGNPAQLLTMGRITFDAPINLNGYATIGLKDGAATSGDNRASLDTWNNCAMTVSGVANTINTEFILRKDLTITTTASSELTVNGTVNSGAIISINGKETDGVTAGGAVTFAGAYNANGLNVGSATTVNLVGAANISGTLTNNGTLTLNGRINANKELALSNLVLADAAGNTVNTANGYLKSADITNVITGTGSTSLNGDLTITGTEATYSIVGTNGNALTTNFSNAYAITTDTSYNANDIAINTTIYVLNGATLDANGTAIEERPIILTSGTTLANTGANISGPASVTELMQNSKIALTGNATINTAGDMGIIGKSYVESFLTLNGNTLTKTGAGKLYLMNTTVSAGTIDLQQGEIILMQNDSHANGITVNNATVFKIAKDAQLTFDSTFGTHEAGNIILTATGTGIINTNRDLVITGNTSNNPASSAFAGTINVAGGTLKLGSNTNGNNDGWKLNMTNATIQLNGGNLYFFGKNSNFGDITVLQNASYLLHATDEAKVTHGTIDIAKDKTLSMSANWTSNIDVDSITGEGNLMLKTGTANNRNPNLVLTVGNLQNSGTISLESGTTLNITAGTIYHSITNAGTINFNGTTQFGDSLAPTEIVYTDLDGSTNTGNGFLTGLTYNELITGTGTVYLGEGFAVSYDGNTSATEDYSNGTLTATFAENNIYYVTNNTPTAMTSGMADLIANGKSIKVENGATLNVDGAVTLSVNNGSLNIATGGKVQYSANRNLTDIIKATHGTGDVVLQNGGSIYGTTGGTTLDFAGNIVVAGGTLNYADVDNYFHGYCLQMEDGTVTLQGGSVRAFGTNMVIGKVVADASSGVSTFTVHQANPVINQNQKTANGLSIGTLQLNSGMVLDANWQTDVHADILTGEGDLNVYYNRTNGSSNTGTMNVSIGNVQDYSGVITLGAKTNGDVTNADRLFVTIGTADSSSTISNSIINHAALTLQGDIIIDANGNYAIYNPDTITDREGSFSYGTQSGFFTAENLQYYLVVGGQNTLNCDSVTLSDGSTTTLQNISGAGVIFTSSTSTTTQEFYIGDTLNYGDLLADTQSGVTADTAFIINGGTLVLQKGESLNGALLSVSDNGGSIELKAGATLTNAQNSAASLIGTGKAEMTFDATYNATIATTDAFTGSVEVKSGNFTLADDVDSLSSLTLGDGVNFQINADTTINVDLVLNGNTEAHQNNSKNLILNGKVSGNGTYTRKASGKLTFNGEVDLAGFDQTHTTPVETVFNKKADIDTVKVGKGDVQFNKGGEFNKASIVEGNIQLAGGTYNIAIMDASEGNNATGRFTIKEKAIVNVSDKLWKSNKEDSAIQLEKDAQLNIAGISIRGTDNTIVATLTNTISDASNSNDLYGTAHAHFEISNANVVVTGNDDIELGNKLTSSSLTQSGTGLVTVTHTNNSLTELVAEKGNINIQNCAELKLDILTIAEGQTIGVHSGTDELKAAQGEATLTVISSATFDRGAELYADLVLQSGAKLISNGTLTLGSDLMLQTGLTLDGLQYEEVMKLAVDGGEVVLVDGIDNLYLGLGTEASNAITLAHQVKANTYFTNLDDSYFLVYDTSAGEGKGKLSIATTVPEPTTATLSLLALMALAAKRRRR